MVKGRLVLENFSGLSVEAVKQDVYATMLLSNLEAVIIEPAQEELARRSEGLKNRQQVNHAVSFHAIKSQMLDLVLGPGSTPEVLRKLHQLCLDNAVACRPGRVVPRRKQSAWRSYHYQRNIKKAGF